MEIGHDIIFLTSRFEKSLKGILVEVFISCRIAIEKSLCFCVTQFIMMLVLKLYNIASMFRGHHKHA